MKKKKMEKINLNTNQSQGEVIWMKGMDDIINLNSENDIDNSKKNNKNKSKNYNNDISDDDSKNKKNQKLNIKIGKNFI
jgi:hypothetical protein